MTTAMTKRHGNLLPQTFVTADSRDRLAAAVTDIVAYFAESYVPAQNDRLSAFQTLCEDLDVEIGSSIKKCKKNIRSAHVNIHDFVRMRRVGGNLSEIKFPSHKALQRVIRSDPSRRFPLHKAKGNEFLEAMLIKL